MAKSSDNTNDRSSKPLRKVPVKPLPPDSGKIIEDIYTDSTGKRDVSLQKIEKTGKRRIPKRLFIVLIVLVVLVVSTAAGFFTFYKRQYFNEQGVTLKVETQNSVTSGGETTVVLTVTNDTSVAIRNVELLLSAPDGWKYERSEPTAGNDKNTLWRLGSVAVRGKRSVNVVGQLAGEVGSVKSFNATVTYRPVNFNYDFTARASDSVTIGSSILELDLQGPTQASPGASVSYTLTYTNNSTDDLRDVRLIAKYPDGFTPTTLDPKPREGNTTWVLDLKSGGTGDITIQGSLSGEVGGSSEFSFVAELQRGAFFERQAETSVVVILIASGLNLKLSVNNSEKDSVASPSQKLQYKLSYENSSDVETGDVTMTAKLSGGALDPASFSDDHGAKLKDGTVVWDVKLVPDLASLKPGASGNIRFSVKTLETPKATSNLGGPTIAAEVSAAIGSSGANVGKQQTVSVGPLHTKVTSKPSLSVDPRYYSDDGEQLGSGPLPPTVGTTTSYRISWFLGNTTNELTNVGVSAAIPSTVFWTGKNITTTAGDISFDPTTRIATWTLNRLPRGVGQETSTLVASFEVSVTPASADLGSLLMLLDASTLNASDSFTGTVLTVKRDKVTTDLTNDPRGAGKGIVVAVPST